MAIEIERRFIVNGEGWKSFAKNQQHLRQGYLANSLNSWTVRVRILREERAWLTLKLKTDDMSNNEFEYLIPINDANSLWELSQTKLKKIRY